MGAYSPDGKILVVVCTRGEILLIEPDTGRPIRQLEHSRALIATHIYHPRHGQVQFAPDGRHFVTWGLGDAACIWDTNSGSLLHELGGHSYCRSAEFSGDGQLLLTASWDLGAQVPESGTWRQAAVCLLRCKQPQITMGKHVLARTGRVY